MDVELFETFLAIVRHGSLNQAAESLFLAQSTLTHRLKQLECQLNTRLFTRTPAGVSLTQDGQRLVPVASSMVEQLHSYMDRSFAPEPLKIVAGRAFASFELPRLLSAYRRMHPQFTCYIRSTLFDESFNALLAGIADMAFLGNEVYHPQLVYQNLPQDEMVVIVHQGHPFIDRPPSIADFGSQDVIAFGTRTFPLRQRVDQYFLGHGVKLPVIMELDSIGAVKRMVMEGLGIAILPSRTVREEIDQKHLWRIDLPGKKLMRPTLIAYPKHKEEDETFTAFLNWVVKEY